LKERYIPVLLQIVHFIVNLDRIETLTKRVCKLTLIWQNPARQYQNTAVRDKEINYNETLN